MSCVGSGDVTAVLHVLELLKSVISEFPKSALKSTCEMILGLLAVHNTVSCYYIICCRMLLRHLLIREPDC